MFVQLTSSAPFSSKPYLTLPHNLINTTHFLLLHIAHIATLMAPGKTMAVVDQRAGAEIVIGAEACNRHSVELLGFPVGVLPLKDLEESGRVKETGFVWMKLKSPYQHFFKGTNALVSYAVEVTAYVEKFKMKKITGIKSRQVLLWVPIAEMSIDDPAGEKIFFKTPMGIGRSFPAAAFLTEEGQKSEQK